MLINYRVKVKIKTRIGFWIHKWIGTDKFNQLNNILISIIYVLQHSHVQPNHIKEGPFPSFWSD
jgi:hypothetical protein